MAQSQSVTTTTEPEPLCLDELPAAIVEQLRALSLAADQCLVCVRSRLALDGCFGDCWLAVFADCLVAAGGGDPLRLPLSALTAVRIETRKGGGLVVVDRDGERLELLCYDQSSATVISAVVAELQRVLDAEDDPVPDFAPLLEDHRSRRCGSCRRRLPEDSKVCPFCVHRASVLRRILAYTGPVRLQLMAMAMLMISGTALALIPPQIARILIDDVLPNPQPLRLLGLVGVLAAVMVGERVLTMIHGRLGIWCGAHVTANIRQAAFEHLQQLSLSYFNKQQTGALMSRISNDTRQMQSFLVDGIQYTVVNLLQIVGIAVVLIWMNPFLGVLVLLPTPFVIIASAIVWHLIYRRFRLLWWTTSMLSGYLNDALGGIRIIKAFGREPEEIKRFAKHNELYRDRFVQAESTWVMLVPLLNFLVQSSLLLVWYFGARSVWDSEGTFTIGSLVAYLSYLALLFGPLQLLTRLNDWLSRALTAAARVFEVLDTPAAIHNVENAVAMPQMQGRISLNKVAFAYEPHTPIIRGLSLTIEPGEMIGLVGHSGAGKSTLINLIGRLYDVDGGSIEIDGVNIREIRLEDLRRQLSYVLQDTYLFNGTIAENIAYGAPTADRGAIIEAAVAANAHGFIINLQDGYDTVVGERGAKLSGGERQRVSIARAILQNPRILILDEATSSVDTETEARIQQALSTLIKGRTTIAIAHRLSTLRNATRLLVIEDGEVAEQGSHEELMQIDDGIYRRLVEIQSEWSRTMGVGG